MIVLDKPLETRFEALIKEHCDAQKQLGIPATVFLLIGSRIGDDLYVAHVAKCPLPETAMDQPESDDTTRKTPTMTPKAPNETIDPEWITDHGRQVLRTLPGGVDIIGLMLFAEKKLLLQGTFRSILLRALKMLSTASSTVNWMRLKPSENLMALMTLEVPLGKPSGGIVDLAKGSDVFQTKVAFQPVQWVGVRATLQMDLKLRVPRSSGNTNFLRLFIASIGDWAKSLLSNNFAIVNGRIRDGSDLITEKSSGKVSGKAKGRQSQQNQNANELVDVELFMKLADKVSSVVSDSCCSVVLKSTLKCRAAVLSKATVDAAVNAVKQDAIRSLYSRAELHCESMAVVEDEEKDTAAVHQLPRRVSTPLPFQSAILISDYLFEGDSVQDAKDSFRDLLSVEIDSAAIDDSLERLITEDDLEAMNVSMPQPVPDSPRTQQITKTALMEERTLTASYVAVAALVAILAVTVYVVFLSLGK
uniref:Protein odr-4 homolog n=1 Tax=Plectus sambesii TaxID=2011161 RepID=A0A914UVT0_9BILA